MDTQIPVIPENPFAVSGCRKFQVDALVDHLCTCTAHSGAKNAHDWSIDQLADLFRTTHKTKTHCYDGVIVTFYNQVKTHGRKRKEKYSRNFFFFIC